PQVGRPGSVEGQSERVEDRSGGLAIGLGNGSALASEACASGKSREILRAGLAHQRSRRHEVGKRGSRVLIGNADLLFERVQLRIAKSLPPFAVQSAVLRLRD